MSVDLTAHSRAAQRVTTHAKPDKPASARIATTHGADPAAISGVENTVQQSSAEGPGQPAKNGGVERDRMLG